MINTLMKKLQPSPKESKEKLGPSIILFTNAGTEKKKPTWWAALIYIIRLVINLNNEITQVSKLIALQENKLDHLGTTELYLSLKSDFLNTAFAVNSYRDFSFLINLYIFKCKKEKRQQYR